PLDEARVPRMKRAHCGYESDIRCVGQTLAQIRDGGGEIQKSLSVLGAWCLVLRASDVPGAASSMVPGREGCLPGTKRLARTRHQARSTRHRHRVTLSRTSGKRPARTSDTYARV